MVADSLDHAQRLIDDGNLIGALDFLTALPAASRTSEMQTQMRDLRQRAAATIPRVPVGGEWPPHYPDPFPGLHNEIPTASATEITTALLGGAVQHHGCLKVDGLFGPDEVATSISLIDQAADPDGRKADRAVYSRVVTEKSNEKFIRGRVEQRGGVLLADSPQATAIVMDELHAAGVVAAMTEHFGVRPFFSLQKSTLRRMEPEPQITGWHQDGSFLDEGVRTMNVWVALTDCGSTHDSPAGDALIFDERFLHRTHLEEGYTKRRYALECWFFAPSHITEAYEPFLV